MYQAGVTSRARWTLGLLFAVLLMINVAILAMATIAELHNDLGRLPPHVSADTAMGVRFGILAVTAAAAWFLARMLYRLLVREEVAPSDSVSPAYGLLSYLVLVAAAYCFLGIGTWLWLPVLFLVVLLWTILTLWMLAGWKPVLAGVLLAIVTAVIVFLALN